MTKLPYPLIRMKDIILKVYLQPKSSKNEIAGAYRDGIKIRVTAPPSEGKANKALIKLLAKELRIPESNIGILKGHHSREKILRIVSSSDSPIHLPHVIF